MLEDHRHLVRIALAHAARQAQAGRRGLEGDEEVVLALQAVAGDIGQNLAHDPPQSVLDEQVVTDQVGHRVPPAGHAGRGAVAAAGAPGPPGSVTSSTTSSR